MPAVGGLVAAWAWGGSGAVTASARAASDSPSLRRSSPSPHRRRVSVSVSVSASDLGPEAAPTTADNPGKYAARLTSTTQQPSNTPQQAVFARPPRFRDPRGRHHAAAKRSTPTYACTSVAKPRRIRSSSACTFRPRAS
ncbi:hypothetical protein DENSPDRAFT_845237 [Dentipellis sp. KUC8613]|nr:hypothetical protein DENSPDRAFT_845237 [Dentipellis sp. KUC8613]